ncbi:hypothetical protein OAD04_02090 [Schleiferiaceae bacterium]|nr:hypothetical protein [Schleiferiaceae bacterium]
MIRSRIVTKIGHLTHNQVVAGSSPAGPGSVFSPGIIASARDFGNVAAGIVAGRTGMPIIARGVFDGKELIDTGTLEPAVSRYAQNIGLNMGMDLYLLDVAKKIKYGPKI